KWCNLLSEIEGRKPVYHISKPIDKAQVLRTGEPDSITVDWASDGYRLPTEAEWEYAWWASGRAPGHPEPDGWHLENSEQNTHPVGSRPSSSSKKLHDMTGNVAEWCWDWFGTVTPHGYDADPKGPDKGLHRVIRGGSWADHWMCCRGTYRGNFSPKMPRSVFTGFRPVRMRAARR
ncbi:MAG: SUMF1/EgtB/PvdO family nonheme iron enzyme, partial [Verrucomicrobiae bacterium]|nr:SUMF1/EgtB/PvdO family nonheme iron enzyme [Verrucomicrobiae bacterium]